jgi:hypothetical protein
MAAYSGQRTRFAEDRIDSVLRDLAPGNFANTLDQLYRQLARVKSTRWVGGKDNLCEEFLPHLLENGAFCVVVLRDPRDMLASLNHGRGEEFGGKLKPTLFNLRHWRKSVAFALHLRNHPRFVAVRYEDLVGDPVARLNEIARRLDIPAFSADMFADGIKDQDGTPWGGNSSYAESRRLDSSSVGAYRQVLPQEVVAFTEAVCYPELAALNYPVTIRKEDIPGTIARFVEPCEVRENLREEFAHPDRRSEEADRRDYLFDDVAEILRKAADR